MNDKFIVVCVWGKDWVDSEFHVSEIYGFSYDDVTEMIEQLNRQFDDLLEEHRECDVKIRPHYTSAVTGNYPPPNEESEACWDFEIIEVMPFEEGESE